MGSCKEKPYRNIERLRPSILLLLMAVSLAAACGSSEVATNTPNSIVRSSNNSTAANTLGVNAGDPIANMATNVKVETASNRSETKRQEMRAAGANNASSKPLPINARPAPEDSTITTQLTDVARETRVWRKHPTLAKVEKIYDGKGSSIKVYLRDGRVIDLPGTAIPQLEQVPSATVLTLAGITAAVARPNETKTGRAPKKTDN